MKKFLLILTFLFSFLIGNSQTVTQQDWKVVNEGHWGSFYWGVTRTVNTDAYGRYYYYVYCYSNSFFNSKRDGINYDKASTYIRGVHIQMEEYKYDSSGLKYFNTVKLDIPYYTCDWAHDPNVYVAYFWSYHPYNKFYLTFDEASAFDYSIYK